MVCNRRRQGLACTVAVTRPFEPSLYDLISPSAVTSSRPWQAHCIEFPEKLTEAQSGSTIPYSPQWLLVPLFRLGNQSRLYQHPGFLLDLLYDFRRLCEQFVVRQDDPCHSLFDGFRSHNRCFAWKDFPVVHPGKDRRIRNASDIFLRKYCVSRATCSRQAACYSPLDHYCSR